MLPQTEEQLAKAALCKAPADIYTVGARELISRHCRSFLDAMRATPTELLFSEELQKKLENAGTAYSGAVQKVAIAQMQDAGVSPATVAVQRIAAQPLLAGSAQMGGRTSGAQAPVDDPMREYVFAHQGVSGGPMPAAVQYVRTVSAQGAGAGR